MKKKYNIVAVVSARAGSKGVLNKNIKLLNGKPLILHSLKSLLNIKEIDKVVLSSDSEKILNIAKKLLIILIYLRFFKIMNFLSYFYKIINIL